MLNGMVRWLILIALFAGCRQLAGLDDPLPGDGGTGDGSSGPFCYGTGLVKVCFASEPTGDLSITQTAIDTGAFGCASAADVLSGAGPCYIAATTISLPSGQTTLATGTLPLVLVATETITIAGTLDAAGHHQNSSTPAGGNFSGCQAGSNPNSGTYGGGGEGGSNLAMGGDGGDGGTASGGIAGAALAVPTTLHAGCAGHSGGNSGGSGGKGGGALYLIANTSIAINGRVDVSGAGGSGDGDNSGAGGGAGGSGGMVGLDAPTVNITGAVCAIGGSGASGATGSSGQSGNDATGGSTACTAGSPGTASGGGGSGGAGGVSGIGAVGSAGTTGGGGGGGGSSGYVRIDGTRTGSGAIQPPA
jgi:hypothetical protein